MPTWYSPYHHPHLHGAGRLCIVPSPSIASGGWERARGRLWLQVWCNQFVRRKHYSNISISVIKLLQPQSHYSVRALKCCSRESLRSSIWWTRFAAWWGTWSGELSVRHPVGTGMHRQRDAPLPAWWKPRELWNSEGTAYAPKQEPPIHNLEAKSDM